MGLRWCVVASVLALLAVVQPQLWPLVIFTALNLVLRENFPFSNYPMYSALPEATFYLHIEDADGTPIPSHDHLGVSSPWLKKRLISQLQHHSQRNALKSEPEALEAAAREMMDSLPEPPVGTSLKMVRVEWADNEPVEWVTELVKW